MSSKDNNKDSTSCNEYLDAVKRDTDESGVVTADEIRDDESDQDTDCLVDESWLDLDPDAKEFLNAEASKTFNGFDALLDVMNRDPEVFCNEAAHELGYEVQPDHDEPIPEEFLMELNADKEELPIPDDDIKDEDPIDSHDLPAKTIDE